MLDRAECESLFREAVIACDPAYSVSYQLEKIHEVQGRDRIGIAFGKAAFAMARGAGPVVRGVAISNADDGRELPAGWTKMLAAHPEPDERSVEAGTAVIDLVASARDTDVILALVSGGASSLIERPLIPLDQVRREIRAIAASGATIQELNRARIERSAIKGGKLAAMADAPIVTLALSDVVTDDLAVIGSGPTITGGKDERAIVIAWCEAFAQAVDSAMESGKIGGPWQPRTFQTAFVGDVKQCADLLAASYSWIEGVGWGEPTLRVPADHGEGGRAQQLALEMAKRIRGLERAAFIAGTDGIDGPAPRDRPAPAGAFVDGTTWDAIIAAGIDPDAALARCDAGTALHAVGALVITGPTGINHADVMIIG